MKLCTVSRQTGTTLAGLLALTLSGCDSSVAPMDPEQSMFSHGIQRQADLNKDLAALRAATAHFQNFDKAIAAGFEQITPCWYHSDQGAQGYHYAITDRINGSASLLEPEILMYERQKNGRMRLVGVEYIVPMSMAPAPPTLLGQEFHANTALGLYALHVWLWRHNPVGMFADWNPKVSCEHAPDAEDRA
ncbi:hypothetical protein BH23GEM6_BH23GEM6_27550 [soil metagenome]